MASVTGVGLQYYYCPGAKQRATLTSEFSLFSYIQTMLFCSIGFESFVSLENDNSFYMGYVDLYPHSCSPLHPPFARAQGGWL